MEARQGQCMIGAGSPTAAGSIWRCRCCRRCRRCCIATSRFGPACCDADDLSGASSAGNMDVHDANSNALYKMGKRCAPRRRLRPAGGAQSRWRAAAQCSNSPAIHRPLPAFPQDQGPFPERARDKLHRAAARPGRSHAAKAHGRGGRATAGRGAAWWRDGTAQHACMQSACSLGADAHCCRTLPRPHAPPGQTEVSMIPGSLTAAEFEARRDALKGKTVVCYCERRRQHCACCR